MGRRDGEIEGGRDGKREVERRMVKGEWRAIRKEGSEREREGEGKREVDEKREEKMDEKREGKRMGKRDGIAGRKEKMNGGGRIVREGIH